VGHWVSKEAPCSVDGNTNVHNEAGDPPIDLEVTGCGPLPIVAQDADYSRTMVDFQLHGKTETGRLHQESDVGATRGRIVQIVEPLTSGGGSHILSAGRQTSSTKAKGCESKMGLVSVEGTVTGPAGQATLQFLVDSGASYTLLPDATWRSIGLAPKRSVRFALADGTLIERQVSECHITLPEGDGHTPVILGEPGDEALLGVITLEILGLVLNPFTRTLQPMRMMLA
jgi:predicted aspartyl protease